MKTYYQFSFEGTGNSEMKKKKKGKKGISLLSHPHIRQKKSESKR